MLKIFKEPYVVYKAVNTITSKVYVGVTKRSLKKRLAVHACLSKNPKLYFHYALNKYGFDSFKISIVDTASSSEELAEKEKKWIRILNSKVPNGYNLTDGGEGTLNPTEETRKKISLAHLGRSQTEETKKKISSANKGRKLSEEHKIKVLANLAKGRKKGKNFSKGFKNQSDEHKKNLSLSLKKYWENKRKICSCF